ncbi:MAG: competence/damage-inducible protein A [Flavobacteriales bacterium]
MNLDIISVGDELLIGQTLNTNAHWIAAELDKIGFTIREHVSISDNREHILNRVDYSLKNVDVVLITGGLGPTNDDLTMPVLNEYFGGKLVEDKTVYQDIERLILGRGFDMNERNKKQALVPDNCKVVRNMHGTAPGLWFERENRVVVAMPGVPFEMKVMITDTVIPWLRQKYVLPEIVHQMIYTQGLPESKLAEIIADWEDDLPQNIKLAYLPSPGRVKLRLSSKGNDRKAVQQQIDEQVTKLNAIIPNYIYSFDGRNIEEVIGDMLRNKKATLATAESCTGGYIAHLLTSVSGSSDYFIGSVVSYANQIKINELGVNPADIENYGAVSQQVVEQMAEGVLQKYGVDYAVATSGVAGPNGGTPEKPVGTVWIAVATKTTVTSKLFTFGKIRSINIERSAIAALGMLRGNLQD